MSEQEPYSIEWHKGFQMGLYSGISNERERIIKLLEEHKQAKLTDNEYGYHEDKCDFCANLTGLGVALALIKGENK